MENKPRSAHNLYNPKYVSKLFEEMARTYGVVNLVASFGFTAIWRKLCVVSVSPKAGRICDLMSGGGELLSSIRNHFAGPCDVVALDFCSAACQMLRTRVDFAEGSLTVLEQDVLKSSLPDRSFDRVLCSFGLKTFSKEQLDEVAKILGCILKPGGEFSFVEISIPPSKLLRIPYQFYLRYMVPLIGRLFLGDPYQYRMLSIYTEAFKNCSYFATALRREGLFVEESRYFFGCATGVRGRKPGEGGS